MNHQIQNNSPFVKRSLLLTLIALMPALAQAHPGHGSATSFASGLNHPWHGLDHVLVMLAVGLWAAQLGGRSLWAIPAAFVGAMTVGGALGMMGVPLPRVETGILVSIVAMGVLLATAARLPLMASLLLVGVFALFHGHAHGTEIPLAASGFTYAAGFTCATIMLHAVGIGLGLLAQKRLPVPALRYAGAAIAVCGAGLWLI